MSGKQTPKTPLDHAARSMRSQYVSGGLVVVFSFGAAVYSYSTAMAGPEIFLYALGISAVVVVFRALETWRRAAFVTRRLNEARRAARGGQRRPGLASWDVDVGQADTSGAGHATRDSVAGAQLGLLAGAEAPAAQDLARLVNVDGTPMIPGSQVDVHGKPFGVSDLSGVFDSGGFDFGGSSGSSSMDHGFGSHDSSSSGMGGGFGGMGS
jgi:hypothetical protein